MYAVVHTWISSEWVGTRFQASEEIIFFLFWWSLPSETEKQTRESIIKALRIDMWSGTAHAKKGLQGNNSGITMKWWNRIKQLFDLIYSYKGLLEKSSKLNHISSQWWIFQRKEKTISFLILKGAERKKKRTWWFLSHLLQQWLLWRRALCATLKSGWRWAGSAFLYSRPEEFDRKPSDDWVIQWRDTGWKLTCIYFLYSFVLVIDCYRYADTVGRIWK